VLEEVADLKAKTTGKVSINRWALSHLYQSYQLKEVTRVRRALRKRPTAVTLARQLRSGAHVATSDVIVPILFLVLHS
jgi:hypothetical protein